VKTKNVSKNQLRRLPFYLSYLRSKYQEGVMYISSPQIALGLELSEEQVRKDLALISKSCGKPKTGRSVETLIMDLEEYLGYKNVSKAVIVGAGHLGSALIAYQGFAKYGLDVMAAFDNNPLKIGTIVGDKNIYSLDSLEEVCQKQSVEIGIITVPAEAAQEVCDRLVNLGVRAIWNFAPIKLDVKENVIVQNENMASSLAVLSSKLRK
jgi:redox-sensing transcriptional repressor